MVLEQKDASLFGVEAILAHPFLYGEFAKIGFSSG